MRSSAPTSPFSPSGYTLTERLYQGSRTVVYRAVQTDGQHPVVIKMLRSEYPSFSDLVQFRNQYAVAKNLPISGIVQPLTLEPCGNGYVLVMEDWGGVSLANHVKQQPLAIAETLAIALQLADILHNLHQHRVIHKDIKPANILIHPETKQVKLIDFSIASLLPKETQEIQSPNTLEGTLAYLAPEQTGRMNRGIDFRADFYALGVTLFELLTGQLPFQTSDPMELMHCHIAQPPPLAHEHDLDIPPILAMLVQRLMAKNAEDRYQSALGLKHDLETLQAQYQAQGKLTWFTLGEHDRSDRFLIPETLYGREAEAMALLTAFNRVSDGSRELMLVAGFSGIGKTAVVNEIHKPIVKQRGYFIKGKFDQFNRNIPLSAFVQALRELMAQLLSESDEQLTRWKAQILAAVGGNGQVLIEVIPELAQIIGQQPPAPELAGAAAQNRFNLLFQKFIAVFTQPEHPLVIFLDDLQWADSASLELIKLLMNDQGHLLLLGAYRDNEVSPAHPLMLTVAEVKKLQVIVNTITLAPLQFEDINQLVADTLTCNIELARPLSELINRKTQGNSFFITQFLKALHEEGYIRFNQNRGHWECDITQVQALSLTDDVVEFVAQQLQKLPLETQQVLKLAACIGNQFDLTTLAIASEQSPTEAATALWSALQEGLILPTSQVYKFFQDAMQIEGESLIDLRYRFLHDRVQQAAYALIAEEQKSAIHWYIGTLLWQGWLADRDNKLFDLVNQLNLGQAAISKPVQKSQLAQLNLRAGKKAKLSAAYQSAKNYCETGIALLAKEGWQTYYDLAYTLHYQGAEASYLSGDFDRAEALYQAALQHAQTSLDQAAIYRLQMTQYQLQGRNTEAIAIQRKSLQLLGLVIPTALDEIQQCLDAEIEFVNRFLGQQTIESILDHPKMSDANIEEILRILQILFYAAWLGGQPVLAFLAIAKMTTLSLQYGNSEMSPFGYAGYGMILQVRLKNATQAYEFGRMAVQLCEQFDNADVRGMTNFLFAADVQSWKRPVREADEYYENAYRYGMDAGNWLTVSFMMMQSGSDRLTYGKNLNDLYSTAQSHATFLRQIKSLENLDALTVGVLQPVRQLLGLTPTPLSFDDEHFSEADYLQKYQNTPFHLAWFYSVKIRHAYLFSQIDLYPDLIVKVDLIEGTVPTHTKVPSSVFYALLMHLALIEQSSDDSQRLLNWQAMAPLEEKLTRWQQDCPENIQHKLLLVQAEKARLQGQIAVAIEHYEQSIAQAQAQGYGYEAALANELAAKFYLDWGKENVARGYLQDAYSGYSQWGAKAKLVDLEHRYPRLITPIAHQPKGTSSATTTQFASSTLAITQTLGSQTSLWSSASLADTFDLAAVLKAAQTLSSEIELDKLLTTVLQTALENAGADRGVLLMPHETQWFVEAMAAVNRPAQVDSLPLSSFSEISHPIVNTVKRTLEPMVIGDAIAHPLLANDTYIGQQNTRSLLCLPILHQGKLIAILYLENRVVTGAFTRDRVETLQILASQAAISIANARLYKQVEQHSQTLEAEVERQTHALHQKTIDLEQTLQNLQQTQVQLIQSEKMSALGQLVGGIAHEINNPINFIQGNLSYASGYVRDLVRLVELYQQQYPQENPAIQSAVNDIDLAFIQKDYVRLFDSMKAGSERISQIILNLRNFTRLDEAGLKAVDLHAGIEGALLLLQHRIVETETQPAIQIIKDYGEIPLVTCYASQLNQVFFSLLSNAVDAVQDQNGADNLPVIQIRTELGEEGIRIHISDNGKGISEEIKHRIFEPFFTTKPIGSSTGLGLSISYAILKQHGGTLTCQSQVGVGTNMIIQLPLG
ncbi:trifunctional serine/threonine-protein kinase/ATP-binding protein/sensor histidine kinase [Vacuolonema iberomarrocanum]|uniref:trifunctional serine/threonine-protein kinase/ATP-binding protein/sensor histidine kinase n=1 Tax=Vacuolonema iberomarrocanum TaxID=3454632 RepID=UPI001A0359A3|nr:AAA family ATPase [filamentous cyanobacterium LEGE 07170]